MKERRRSNRIPVCLEVQLKRNRWERHVTEDISRRGLYVRIAGPCPVAQLMQVRVVVPHEKEPLEMLAKVARRLSPWEALAVGRLPGVGVEFFCLSNLVLQQWDRFIQAAVHHLEAEPGIDSYALYQRIESDPEPAAPSAAASQVPGHEGDAAQGSASSSTGAGPGGQGALRTPSGAKPRGNEADNRSNLIFRVQNVARLEQFLNEELRQGELKLQIPYRMEEAAEVNLRVIHPRTQEEFVLAGHIRGGRNNGYAIRFTDPPESVLPDFRMFVSTGQSASDA